MRVQRAKSLTERAAGARLRAGVAALLLITAVAAARGQDSQALFAIRPPGTIFILYHPDECRVSFGYPTADEMSPSHKLLTDQSFHTYEDAERAIQTIELCQSTRAAVEARSAITLELACDGTTSEDSLADQPQIKALADALKAAELKRQLFRLEYHPNLGPSDDRHTAVSQQCADRIKRVLSERFGIEPARLLAVGLGSLRPCRTGLTTCTPARLVVINLGN
jgi:hypothetical protein